MQCRLAIVSCSDTLLAVDLQKLPSDKFDTEIINPFRLQILPFKRAIGGCVKEEIRASSLLKSGGRSLRLEGRDGVLTVSTDQFSGRKAPEWVFELPVDKPLYICVEVKGKPALEKNYFYALNSDSLHLPVNNVAEYTGGCGTLNHSYSLTDNSLWEYSARDHDDFLFALGGKYRLLCERQRNGEILLIYLSGAETAPAKWKKGDVKGILTPTSSPMIYNLLWIDAFGHQIDDEAYAQFTDHNQLNLVFPIHKSSVTFSHITVASQTMPMSADGDL